MSENTHTLLLQLFAIFVWAKVFAEMFERMTLPAVLGEIMAGVVLGPHATQLVLATEPGQSISSLAEIGAIFLLFTVGLETRPQELIRVGRASLGVAIAGIAAPFLMGFIYLHARGEALHESIFIAAAMVATSVGITARVLSDLNALNIRAAKIILGAAVFDDILGMVLLTVVSGLATTGTIRWLHLGVLIGEALGFALFMIFVGPRVVRRMRPGVQRMSTRDAPLILSFAICLGLSVAATQIGMAAIIGAFFAGLVFADYSPEWNLQPRVHAITEFLAPFFFFVMGARLDVTLFRGEVWVVALVISALAIISKVIGCGLPLIRSGLRTALQVGIGMMPRGEVALIVALIGLQSGAISQAGYAVVIFMTAVTTILAPPLLRPLFRVPGTDLPSGTPPVPEEVSGTRLG